MTRIRSAPNVYETFQKKQTAWSRWCSSPDPWFRLGRFWQHYRRVSSVVRHCAGGDVNGTFVAQASEEGGEGGGAALDQVIGMSAVAAVVSLALLWIGYLHRQRRITWLKNLAERLGTKFKRPPWVALQVFLFTATIIAALFGFIWDVSLHIGKGRDAGPLANPAHYFILFGLFLLFIAGTLGDRPALRQARSRRDPHHPHLVCPGRRRADGAVRAVRAHRIPARRHLAPHLRPGRHALGPNASHADRRRRTVADRRAAAGVRGQTNAWAPDAQPDDTWYLKLVAATCRSAACSSGCRCSRSSTTSASSSSGWCCSP